MKKLLSALVVLCMIFIFVACVDGGKDENSSQSSAPVSEGGNQSNTDTTSEETEQEEYEKLNRRFDDTVVIFGKKDGLHTYARQQWEYDDEVEGDAINDAVYDRNMWLYENYGITVRYIASTSTEYFIAKDVINMIEGGTQDYDIVCDGLTTMASLAKGQYLYALNDLSPYLDLNHSWWDSRVNSDLSIAGKNYYAAGDILITDDEYTYCLLYNKELIEKNLISADYNNRSLYQIVDDGDWTYDKLFAIAKKCAAITTGGSTMTLDDTWGYVGDIGCLQVMMAGGGYVMAEKNLDDIPSLNVVNDRSLTLFNTLIGYMNDTTYSKFTERFGVDGYYGVAERMFSEGRIAFFNVKLSSLTTVLKNTETNTVIGVLPIPKASENQDYYYNPAATLHFSCVGIPVSVDLERVDTVCATLEALGYLGQQKLTGAYIETTLKVKRADETEDANMIDLILKTRSFDLATAYDWGGLNSFFNKFAGSTNTNFVSSWDEISTKAQTELEETIAKFLEAENG